MADNLEIKVSGSKGTPIIIQDAGPLDVEVSSSPNERVNINKAELKLQILSSVAGAKGDSMYDIAVKHGYTGTEEEFINEFMAGGSGNGFYNLDNEHPITGGNYTLDTAVEVVSSDTSITDETKNGMIITFWDGGEWKTYRYKLFYDPAQPSDFANVDNWEEFKGSGGGGEETGRIILRRESDNMTTKVGTPVHIRFFYDHVTGTGEEQQSTGNAGIAKIIISRAGYTQTLNRTLTAGSHSDIDITRYMGIGVTSVRLQVTVDTGLVQQSAALAWTISEVALNLTSDSLTGYTVVEQGTNLEVAYTLESGSADTKAVILYLDGVQYAQNTVATSVGSGLFNVDTTSLAHGQHTIQLRAQQAMGEIDEYEQPVLLYSNLIYTVIGVYTQAGTTPLLTMKVDIADGSTVFGQNEPLSLNLNQYETLTFSYGARSYDNISTEVVIKEGEDTIATATNNRESVDYSVRVLTSGSHSYSVNVGETAQIAIGVTATEVDLGVEVPSGRTMYLDAIQHGHSNTDANRNTWTNTEGGVQTSTVMTDFAWSGDGWINGALRLKGDARAEVSYRPLQATASGGMVCGFKYKCTDVEEGSEDEKIISCLDSNGTGFFITPNEITIQQNGTVRTTMKTAEGNVYDVAFVVWPASGSSSDARKNARFIYIFIDGISSGCYRLAEGSTMFQPTSVPISIGANGVTTDIYRMWAYSRALNDSEVLDTFILDQDDNIDTLLEKRDDNAILDATGNVTPDSLPDGIRVMIITGQAVEPSSGETMASVLAAAKYNDKSTYFPAMEISSYIKGASDRSKNFIARNNGTGQETGKNIPLRIRLQGTSSLAYPVKNYRIYTNKSEMYVGNNPDMPFGETGELANKGLFAMHDTSAPVNVWCLKADYAESSGTHNTGMARMVNDTLKAINVLTPAQRDVDDTEYPYDVRTTVDGEPCVLFYRETLTDTPILLGKFNFNNDKSTEAVYGFTGINGYHDVAPLDDIDNTETEFVAQQYKTATGEDLEVDLTECWEFKNNEDPMGSFLDDDFTTTVTDPDSGDVTPRWLGTFEARYPDEDDLNDKFADVSDPIVPHYLSTLVSWVKSTRVLDTDTEEQAAAKLTKFRNELPLYFDVEHLCSYFVFTQMMACLDQMVKNMMMAFWYDKNANSSSPMGKVRAYMIFYDNDTILGVINNGRLLAPYNVTRQTIQMYDAQQKPVYFYAGHESVLWNNLATQFPTEIRNAYVKLRGYLTNARIFQYFDVQQTDKFCERIYNLDALNKYVAPTGMSESAVSPYRDLMQGNRKSHRHFFVNKRMSIFDNEWRAGEYYSSANEISFKGISAANSSIGFALKQAGNVEVQSDVSDDFVKNYPTPANTDTYIQKLTPSAVGTIFHIYGMRQLTKLNVAQWDFDQLNLGNFQYLEEFVFGSKYKQSLNWKESGGYIYNGGNVAIQTGLTNLEGCRVVLQIKLVTIDGNCFIFGNWNSNNNFDSVNIYKQRTFNLRRGREDILVYSNSLQVNYLYNISAKFKNGNNVLIINDTEYNDNNTYPTVQSEVLLLGISKEGSDAGYYVNAKCYSFLVYDDNDNLIRDMWPAIDDNGVACMYDYVTEQYFYSKGQGTLSVSQSVIDMKNGTLSNPFTKPYYNSGLIIGDSMPRLKRFIAQNLDALPSADLSGCSMIEEIDLEGSKAMSSVNIPVGAPLTKYKLPTAGSWRNSGGYIENQINASFIDINYIPNYKTKLRIKVGKCTSENSNTIIASRTSPNVESLCLFRTGTGNYYDFYWGNSSNSIYFATVDKMLTTSIKTIEVVPDLNGNASLLFDGINKGTQNSGTWNGTKSLNLFAWVNDIVSGTCQIYSLEIWDNNTLVREMYPAIDNNGVACMYDYISGQFFYNQGTGEFTVSQEVIATASFHNFTPYQLSLVGLPSLDEWNYEEETGLDYGAPSKIQSLTFRECPLIDGFDLLKTIAGANNTALSTVNVTLPAAISGPIADLITIANLWNSNTGEASNLKVYGSYTVTDESLTTAQCAAIGYDPSGAATQMSSKIYGLMVTIDQSTIVEIILQSYDPNADGYNPAVCIILEQAGYGSYIDVNDKTKGWFMTQTQASSISNFNHTFKGKTTVSDVNGIVGVVGTSYNFTSFIEFKYFTSITLLSGLKTNFSNTSLLDSIEFPNTLNTLNDQWCSNSRLMTAGFNMKFPVTLSTIGDNAFRGVPFGTQTNYFLTFYGLTPPNLSANNAFYNTPTKIYVPAEAVNSYKSAASWSAYASIIEAIPSN